MPRYQYSTESAPPAPILSVRIGRPVPHSPSFYPHLWILVRTSASSLRASRCTWNCQLWTA